MARRFARVLEFDRNGPPLSGTKAQQQAIRDAVDRHAPYGSPLDKTLFKLDVAVNLKGRRFVPVGFADLEPMGLLGFCFPTYIQLHQGLHPDWIERTFLHELGHLVGWHVLTPSDRTEAWAIGFQQWISQGQDHDSPIWKRLETA